MKKLIRNLILASTAFIFVASFYPGIKYDNLADLAVAALIFSLLVQFVKPILKLLTLPFNLFSFGLFSVLINIAILFLVGVFVSGFHVVGFSFAGGSFSGFILPAVSLTTILSAIVASAIIGLVATFLQFIFR